MASQPNSGDKAVAVRWVGHATVLLESPGWRLLTDPVLGWRVGALRRLAPPVAPGVTDGIDAVLISHAHADHLDLPSLRRIGRKVPVIAPPAAARVLRRRGFASVQEATAGAVLRLGAATVEVTPARHDGRRWPWGGPADAVGLLVHGDPAVYFAGDTDLFPEMSLLAGRVGVALLPVAGWGSGLGPGHLDPERAAEAAATIKPRVAIPIHWGTFAPIWSQASVARSHRASVDAFVARAAAIAPGVEVRVLAPLERTRWCGHPTVGRASAVAPALGGRDDRSDG